MAFSQHADTLLAPELYAWLDGFVLKPNMRSKGQRLGSFSNKQIGSSLHFADHKSYLPGDDTRHIDWKIFARSNKLALKRFEKESELLCNILLDTSASMRFSGLGPTKLNFASKLAAALSYVLLKQGERVAIRTIGDNHSEFRPAKSGLKHYRSVEGLLNNTLHRSAQGTNKLHQELREHSLSSSSHGGWTIIISDFFDDIALLKKELKLIQAKGLRVLAITTLDAHELDLPWDKLVRFVPLEGGEDIVADPKSLKRSYKKKIQHFLNSMDATVTAVGGTFRLCPTHVSIKDTILSLFGSNR